jgi:hypothetical protein
MSPAASRQLRNTVVHGDCVAVMRRMESASVDFILTDPPYLCRYKARDGRTVINDDRDDWLEPAFAEMYRLLKPDSLCVSFYGWHSADKFIGAWRKAGFPDCRTHCLPQALRVFGPLSRSATRAGLPAREGQAAAVLGRRARRD